MYHHTAGDDDNEEHCATIRCAAGSDSSLLASRDFLIAHCLDAVLRLRGIYPKRLEAGWPHPNGSAR